MHGPPAKIGRLQGFVGTILKDNDSAMFLLFFSQSHFALSRFLLEPHIDFLSILQQNKQILIDAVVHAVNEDYVEMANDFTRLGFLAPGTDVSPIIPALEAIWQNSAGKGVSDFNFRSVTGNLSLYFFFFGAGDVIVSLKSYIWYIPFHAL